VVLSRYAARDVLRQMALLLLDGAALTSERFKEIVTAMKDGMELRGRELFHPIRLALAGRAGEGELDRVILLLDEAAALSFGSPVKSARTRMLEFCSALD
jgi:nondiscriminating glutamyl-tRNA synthetase